MNDRHKEAYGERMRSLLYEDHLGNMSEDDRQELEENELLKTAEELEFIRMANAETNALLERVGLDPYIVPERNFHKIKTDLFKKYKLGSEGILTAGYFQAKHQMILLNADVVSADRLYEALSIFHELLHMKSYLAYHISVQESEDGFYDLTTTKYREGVDVDSVPREGSADRKRYHFYGLDEAIIAQAEKEYLRKILQSSFFSAEQQLLLSPDVVEVKGYLKQEWGIPEDEVYAVDMAKGEFFSVGYRAQRRVLDYLCEEISKDTGKSPEEIQGEFLKSQLTGRLLVLAHLVEDSFGKGSFRELGKMTEKKETAFDTLALLKGKRKLRQGK